MRIEHESTPALHDADHPDSLRLWETPWMIAPNDIKHFRVPVYAHFGNGPFHAVEYAADWDIEGLLGEFGDRLIRSRMELERRIAHADQTKKAVVLFRAEDDLFVFCDGSALVAYASDAGRARAEVLRLAPLYATRQRPKDAASFKVLEVFARSIETHDVPIPLSARHSRAGLAMHYGEDFPEWEGWFTGMLRRGRNTISILQGDPGTGKTSFLRHLIVRMRKTHRFYFLPPNEVSFLLRASALGFWLAECKRANQRPPILIIEDGEKALLRRGPDNHQDVSNILNVADGLLGHCIRAHVICTVNCPEGEIDPAVTRPGRLLSWRPFRRLNRSEAQRLADHRRLAIPDREDYTLADIYHTDRRQVTWEQTRRAGFGAALVVPVKDSP